MADEELQLLKQNKEFVLDHEWIPLTKAGLDSVDDVLNPEAHQVPRHSVVRGTKCARKGDWW
jgi:hypothetical protein